MSKWISLSERERLEIIGTQLYHCYQRDRHWFWGKANGAPELIDLAGFVWNEERALSLLNSYACYHLTKMFPKMFRVTILKDEFTSTDETLCAAIYKAALRASGHDI